MKAILLLLALVLVAAGCGSSQYAALPADKQITVVTTAYPLFEAASTIGGGRVHVTNLLPLDPFAVPTAAQAQELQDADLVLTLGEGAQPAIDFALQGRTKPTLDALQWFATHSTPGRASVDPYVWEDPLNMVTIVQKVRDQLTSMDAGGTAQYAKYTANLSKDYTTLDKRITATLATCKSKEFVAKDDRWAYLAEHYALNYTPLGSNSDIPQAVARTKATTVYFESLPSLQDAKTILNTYGVRVAVLDPAISQTDQARRGGANYETVMDQNLAALISGLGCANDVSVSN